MPLLIEICVDGLENALAALKGGADRIELCADIPRDGTTPSIGAVTTACDKKVNINTPVHVLVRPRAGDFVYSPAELMSMVHDILHAQAAGAAGVVIGLLQGDGRIDLKWTRRLVEAARPLSVTFHRAFDLTPDPIEALDQLAELGVDRILTSGRPGKARDHLPILADLVKRSAGKGPILLAAGGVNADDLPALASIGLVEAHAGSSILGPDAQVDPARVRALVEAACRA